MESRSKMPPPPERKKRGDGEREKDKTDGLPLRHANHGSRVKLGALWERPNQELFLIFSGSPSPCGFFRFRSLTCLLVLGVGDLCG